MVLRIDHMCPQKFEQRHFLSELGSYEDIRKQPTLFTMFILSPQYMVCYPTPNTLGPISL